MVVLIDDPNKAKKNGYPGVRINDKSQVGLGLSM
jgi:hypothetical protein